MMSPEKFQDSLKGPISLVMTPFKENGDLDVTALKEMLKHLVKKFKGKDVVFLAGGSTGEFYALNDEEYKLYVKTVVEAVNGEIPLLIGTARAATRYTIEASKYAQDAGADGLLIVNVFYHPTFEECIYNHYKEIANSLKIGIVIYNNPMTTKLYIYPDLMKRLSKIDNIIGLKENTNNPMLFYRMFKTIDPKDMKVFTGLGETMFKYTALVGDRAFVCDIANYVPDIAFSIYDAAVARDYDKMAELIDKIDPVYQFIGKLGKKYGPVPSPITNYLQLDGIPIYQSVIKEAMKLIGLNVGKVRGPMYNLNKEEVNELRSILKLVGAL